MKNRLQQSITAKAKLPGTHVVYQEDVHDFDRLITMLRLAVSSNRNINNKKFAKIVREALNNTTYGNSDEVLATLTILYKSQNPLRDFARLSEDVLRSYDNDNQTMVDVE